LYVIFTSCSATKDDSIPIPSSSRIVQPSYYLDNPTLVSKLQEMRKRIFDDPRALIGYRDTHASDLYMRTGKAYKDLFKNNYDRLKEGLLIGNNIEWFFLSGGYGIVHSLEKARKYQATFSQSIARQKNIPYTEKLWNGILPSICDAILSKFSPEYVYVFGSRAYTQFIKNTRHWHSNDNIRMFESTGLGGSSWLSPLLNKLLDSIFDNDVHNFNTKYPKFVKQG